MRPRPPPLQRRLAEDRRWRGRLTSVRPGGRGARRARILAAGLAALMGLLILWLAVPRVVASALLALRDPVIRQIDAGQQISAAERLGLIASRELALSWVDDRNAHGERAAALAQMALEEAPRNATRSEALEHAVQALRAALAAAPADPMAWMQLGYLTVLLEGDTNRSAAEALLVSIRTGALEVPELLRRRLFWSLAHWEFYDGEERRQVADQIRLAWRVAPGDVADLALHVPEFSDLIASALEPIPPARDQLLAALAFADIPSLPRPSPATASTPAAFGAP